MGSRTIFRIRLLAFCLIIFAVVAMARLFFMQIVKGNYYSDLADHQYANTGSTIFDRGSIVFKNKDGSEISAATLKTGFLLVINPTKIKDPKVAYAALNKLLLLDEAAFMKKATKANDPYEEITNHIEATTSDAILALKLPGVALYKERWRFYPNKTLASHVIGLLGFKGDEYLGRYGLEKEYESTLKRTTNTLFVNFFAEIFSSLGGSISDKKEQGQDEGDIVLTIEPTVQATLEKELLGVKDKWHASSAGGIVIDPVTGEIIAMAALPNFDPGGKQADVSALNNSLVENSYEMGSIVKPLTMAAALDAKVLTAQTTYNDKGFIILNTAKISNYDGKGRGVIPMQEVLNQSLNTGAVFAMQKLGHERFRNYMLAYGLGKKTAVDLPDEGTGLVKNLDSPRDVEYATASFGQGIAVTPIAIARALASLSNGGKLIRPHVVKEIRYAAALPKKVVPVEQGTTIKPETSAEITRMLVQVVDTALMQGKAKLDHYAVAAKTGTAQIAKPAGGGYYDDRYLHTFFGYFPAYKPKFLVFFYLRDPQGVKYATETLTPPFMDMTKFLISYYQLPPDR